MNLGKSESELKRLDQQQATIKEFQERLIFEGVWRSCLGCINFNKSRNECMIFKAQPPAEIIVHGCRDFDKDIPF